MLTAALFLLFGLSINIAIAWTAARLASIKTMDDVLWGVRVVHQADAADGGHAGNYLGAGPPLPSLSWPVSKLHHEYVRGRSSWTAGIRLHTLAHWKALPLDPIWPGLIFNSLFYAALAFGLWHVPRVIWEVWREDSRRSRGQCPACGYPQADLPPAAPCPECGEKS